MGRRAAKALSLAVLGVAAVPVGIVATAEQAAACGGLVGENGTIQLQRTTTLAAYHDGVERYVTAFQFSGEGKSVGSIVPLPGEPTAVERAGDWTLQRLALEVAPPATEEFGALDAAAETADRAEVILETQIDALDITVIRGGGDQVGEWAIDNGFLLTPDAPEMLDFYAERSPYFMAAKFDAQRARDLGQVAGQSTPIMATIPIDEPWVPLRILALGLDSEQIVEADVFLLTPREPNLLVGGPGVDLTRSEPASGLLLDDLRSDVGMEWVPQEAWLSYLQVDTPAGDLDFDLAASTRRGTQPSLVDAGVPEPQAVPVGASAGGFPLWLIMSGVGAAVLVVIAGRAWQARRPASWGTNDGR